MSFTKVNAAGIGTTQPLTLSGVNLSGVVTASGLYVTGVSTFTGNVSIAGTLTYEDVTNVDSVGLITARSGIQITGGSGLDLTGSLGIITATTYKVGAAVTISSGGVEVVGVTTTQTLKVGTAGTTLNTTALGDVTTLGKFGVGTASPDELLHVELASTDTATIKLENTDGFHIFKENNGNLTIADSVSDRIRLDSSGRLLVGTTSETSGIQLVVQGNPSDATTHGVLAIKRGSANPTDNSALGYLQFRDSASRNGAQIVGVCDGDWATNDYPGRLEFYTTADNAASPTERMRIDSSGNVGIGTTNPAAPLVLYNAAASMRFQNSNTGTGASDGLFVGMGGASSTKAYVYTYENDDLVFGTNGSEVGKFDSSGKLLLGTSSSGGTGVSSLQVRNDSGHNIEIIRSSTDANPVRLRFAKSRGTEGSPTSVSNGDIIGQMLFHPHDGTDYGNTCAAIEAVIDGTPGSNDTPGRLVFYTTADGANSATERMRIDQRGDTFFGVTSAQISTNSGSGGHFIGRPGEHVGFAVANDPVAYLNRIGGDGTIIGLRHAGVTEGTISSSGSTISYNGAHLSRWSQLPGGATREEILRGTVLSNIDEMCDWGEEENEQLNRMKVSDVEGDKNVSGVFQAWDDDDDTYTDDFYCAMTGDFIIRIAQGVNVQRGDLLMSAGDGTAKPQGDGFVQDKTIAKVTSTHVTCTYDDGSYCVPCVLMAC